MTPLIDRKERDMEGTGRRDPDRIKRQDNDRCSFLTAFPIYYSIQNVEILISWWLAWLNPLSDCEMLLLIFEVLNFSVPSFKLISNCLKERRTNKYPRFSHVPLSSRSRCPRPHYFHISIVCLQQNWLKSKWNCLQTFSNSTILRENHWDRVCWKIIICPEINELRSSFVSFFSYYKKVKLILDGFSAVVQGPSLEHFKAISQKTKFAVSWFYPSSCSASVKHSLEFLINFHLKFSNRNKNLEVHQ